MRVRLTFFIAVIFSIPFLGAAQQKDTLVKKLDSLKVQVDSTGKQYNNIEQTNYNERTKVNARTYGILLVDDFKQQITSPFHINKQYWLKVGGFALLSGVVALTDKPINRFAVNLRDHNKGVVSISHYVTNFGATYEVYTLAAFGAYGVIFKSEKVKTTTLLATQAYIVAGAIEIAGKFISGRQRPFYYDPKTGQNAPTFHGPFYQFQKDANYTSGQKHPKTSYTSFPSGHTTAAFSAATVFAKEYRDRPIVPIIAYSAATLIGLSRLTENKHWPTDILVGAALGYLSGKQVVNNYHRYARIQNEKKKKGSLTFTLEPFYGQLLPGLTYQF